MENHQTVQFQVRDSESSAEDLCDQLASYRLSHDEPAGVLVFSCIGRGAAFYGTENHDAGWAQQILETPQIGGIFCSGEIATRYGETYIHGYTTVMGVFRKREWS